MIEIRDPNPPIHTNKKHIKIQIKNLPIQKSILHLIPARKLLPSFLPCVQSVKLKFSIIDPHPSGNTSRPMKKFFTLPTLQFPEQKIITQINYKVFLNRKQGGLGWASEDVGPLSKLNILSFQNNMEELIRSFHSLLIPPYIVFTGKTSRPMKKSFTLPILQFPEQKIITQINNKVFLNRKQGGLGWASEDMGPLYNLNILPFQNKMEELVHSFHSLPIPPYIVFTRKILINNEP